MMNITKDKKKPKVAAYYYPWWGNDFHRGEYYMRRNLQPPQEPQLGEYDDTNPNVIKQHLSWSRQANIKVWVCSWWGPNEREDTTMREVILPHPDLDNLEISLVYETVDRVKETDRVYDFSNVIPDIQHIADHYFNHPNFLRINNQPVLFIYLSRDLDLFGILGDVVSLIRQAAASCGHDLYIVGDQVWKDAPVDPELYEAFDLLDGVTAYDVYGNLQTEEEDLYYDLYARQSGIDLFYARQQAWKVACHGKCGFFPSLSPGFNKRDNNITYLLSRKLNETSAYGSLFQAMAINAVSLIDDAADCIIVVTSFNEWHEDTQIEPVKMAGAVATCQPLNVTFGLTYEPYGDLHLNILLRPRTTILAFIPRTEEVPQEKWPLVRVASGRSVALQ